MVNLLLLFFLLLRLLTFSLSLKIETLTASPLSPSPPFPPSDIAFHNTLQQHCGIQIPGFHHASLSPRGGRRFFAIQHPAASVTITRSSLRPEERSREARLHDAWNGWQPSFNEQLYPEWELLDTHLDFILYQEPPLEDEIQQRRFLRRYPNVTQWGWVEARLMPNAN